MLLVIGTIRLSAADLEAARPAIEAMVIASRGENGCEHYSYAEDVLEPGLIHVKELWADQAALDRHFMTDHIAVWRASWAALGIVDRDLSLYELGDPKPT